ncbi:MAG: HIT domain-containing protein, partial [Planctomycetota bacterium]|nr:HIT domain-containing protein [Planctomycetota bacterium]
DGIGGDGRHDSCFLCAARDSKEDRRSLVFMRRPHAFAVLNHFPYNNGHALVVPATHKGNLEDLTDDEMLALMHLARDVMTLQKRLMRPDGFNVGFNFGRAAGAGLPEHLHLHIVPRWNGDTYFMQVLAYIKVIPLYLEFLYDRLREELDAGATGKP